MSGSRHGGRKGLGENPCPTRVPVLWAGRCGGHTLHTAPCGCLAVGIQGLRLREGGCVWTGSSWKSLGLMEARDDRFSVLDIP
jgi:hypothetical protein